MSFNESALPPVGKHGHVSPDDPRALWTFTPSLAAAILFTVLFGLAVVAHSIQAIYYHKRFCWVLVMSATWQTIAFIFRCLAIQVDQTQPGIFVPSQLLILLAPLWTNAFLYMLLGRMTYFFLPDQEISGVPARRFTRIFVSLDIIAFMIQGAGGTLGSNPGDTLSNSVVMTGIHVYMGGIGFQELSLLFFLYIVVGFHRKMKAIDDRPLRQNPWKPLLYALYTAFALITLRIVYRMVEYAFGPRAYMPTHEALVYSFDSLPMLAAIVLFNLVHPGRTLVGPGSEFRQGSGEKGKPAMEERTSAESQAGLVNGASMA